MITMNESEFSKYEFKNILDNSAKNLINLLFSLKFSIFHKYIL